MSSRISLINEILSTFKNPSYLEIGYGSGNCFENINAHNKICCDPSPRIPDKFYNNKNCVLLSSDDFFAQNNKKFDVIFIDGHHEYEYVRRDFFNSIDSLNEGGYVIIHDCNPPNEWRCRPIAQFIEGEPWNGDGGYRLITELYASSSNYTWKTSYEDEGCSVISRGQRIPRPLLAQNWETFDNNRSEILNLCSMIEIISQIKGGN